MEYHNRLPSDEIHKYWKLRIKRFEECEDEWVKIGDDIEIRTFFTNARYNIYQRDLNGRAMLFYLKIITRFLSELSLEKIGPFRPSLSDDFVQTFVQRMKDEFL